MGKEKKNHLSTIQFRFRIKAAERKTKIRANQPNQATAKQHPNQATSTTVGE
jgi:hypothetical protein